MVDVNIGSLDEVGLVKDTIDYRLGPNAWTRAENIRIRETGVGPISGEIQVLGTPGVDPYFAMGVRGPSQMWWLYTSLTKGYVYDGTDHTDITRTSGGDYGASNAFEWQSTMLGGIPILNNGVDDPQYWASYSKATKLADLSNWPASTTARIIRAFGSYLVAFNVTKSGTNYPHMVKWSNPASVGTLPNSWDETLDTNDAGENELADAESGQIMNALQLGGVMFVYKESSTWTMRFIGGRNIFAFRQYFETEGIISRKAVASVMDSSHHLIVTQTDVLIHNGSSRPRSILDRRMRRTLFSALNKDNIDQLFVFDNPAQKEAWICYTEAGNTVPNKAIIWNYSKGFPGQLTERDITFQNVTEGFLTDDIPDTWDSLTETWDNIGWAWNSITGRSVVVVDPTNSKFRQLDTGIDIDGTSFSAVLERSSLAVIGRDHAGKVITDFTKRKILNRIWVEATGIPFNVQVGSQETVRGDVTWTTAQSFDPSTDLYLDVVTQGKALAVRFSSDADGLWEIHGYTLVMELLGRF